MSNERHFITRRTFAGTMGAEVMMTTGALASCSSPTASKSGVVSSANSSSSASSSSSSACVSVASSSNKSGDSAGKLEVFDMHADTVTRIAMGEYPPYSDHDTSASGTLLSNTGELSADRMGDTRWVQCYAIWVVDDDSMMSHIDWYHQAAAWFHKQMEQHSERFTQARSFADIPGILKSGKVAAVLTVENAACLDAGFDVIDEFVEDGVLISGITWNAKNVLGSGNDTGEGLTDMGRRFIAALEERNIVVDVSHLNERGFWELEETATKPYIATHSNARVVCNHRRNLTDDQFRAIVARGGIVGLNFHQSFVCEDARQYDFDDLAEHVDHWLELGGEDFIAMGSDRDGATIPAWLADCSAQAHLFSCFEERFGAKIARKIFFDNARRFFRW